MKRAILVAVVLAMLAAPAAAKTLRIGLAEDPDTLDPTLSRTLVARIVLVAMCDKLFDVGPTLEIVPQLATDYAWSDDNKTLTLALRRGVTFQNGETFDAAAVKFSLERHLTLSRHQPQGRNRRHRRRRCRRRSYGAAQSVDALRATVEPAR
jgi:peptide/nickel transport system substrate-binding protein